MAKQQFQWERDAEPRPEDESHAVGALEGRGGKQRKRESEELNQLAKRIVALAAHEWAHLPLNDATLEQLTIAKRLQTGKRLRNAYRRQMLAVAGALRRDDHSAVREALNGVFGSTPKDRALMEIEVWRTRILDTGDAAIDALMEEHPDADRQRLRTIARQARKQRGPDKNGKPGQDGKAFRELFAALREAFGV
jgi:ribosome-associated protein